MKFKYFLRGLGTGIIFTSIICLVAFQNAEMGSISDKEVIERAKELGLVEKEESVKDSFTSESTKSDKEVSETQTTEHVTEEGQSSTADISKTETEQNETTEKNTTQKQNVQNTTEEKTTEKTTTEQATTESITEKKTVTITIKGGSTSYPVCQKLQELGVIQDATDFDNYLIKNGYANRIRVGTHTLTIGMTYEEIAVAISDPQ